MSGMKSGQQSLPLDLSVSGVKPAATDVDGTYAEMLALLDQFERDNPDVAAAAVAREVNMLLGRPQPPATKRERPSSLAPNEHPRKDDEAPFGWFQGIARYLPAVLTKERQIQAARSVEVGLFAQERLDAIDRDTVSSSDLRDLRRLAEHGQTEYELLILSNLRLVFHWSHGVAKTLGLDWAQDAFQVGVFGLIRGIQGWDYRMGYNLSTYVSWHIRAQIQRWRPNETLIIRLPVHIWEQRKELDPATSDATERAALNAIAIEYLEDVLDDLAGVPWDCGLEEVEDRVERAETLSAVFSELDSREGDILRRHYGLHYRYGEAMTLDQIGLIYGLTRERIRQIEAKAIKKLARRMRAREASTDDNGV